MIERRPLRIPTLGVSVDSTGCDVDDLVFCAAVQVWVGADEPWRTLAERAVASGWVGVESLAGMDGSVAELTRDNVSAYGQAVADTVAAVRTWDRQTDAQRTFPLVECGFRPGGSRFQEVLADGSLRYEIRDVAFLFSQGDLTAPVRDPALAGVLAIEVGQRVPLTTVRDALQTLS
jgi:UDP-N-acetylmuramate dehydrogenase